MRARAVLFLAASLVLASACRSAAPGGSGSGSGAPAAHDALAEAPVVVPPFAVREGAPDLYLAWYDGAGAAHTATRIGDVPAEHRARVRVDSLAVPPEQKLDPDFVYVADLSKPGADGSYTVRKVARDDLERAVLPASALTVPSQATASVAAAQDIVLYGASWCGACKQARRFFQQKGLSFVDKDIEREPGARSEMLAKARAQGVSTSGIPVIDVRGVLMGGFDPRAIESALSAN